MYCFLACLTAFNPVISSHSFACNLETFDLMSKDITQSCLNLPGPARSPPILKPKKDETEVFQMILDNKHTERLKKEKSKPFFLSHSNHRRNGRAPRSSIQSRLRCHGNGN